MSDVLDRPVRLQDSKKMELLRVLGGRDECATYVGVVRNELVATGSLDRYVRL